MKTVIAGTDFSKSSINACRYAAMLATKLNCKLTLFNLFNAPIFHSNMGMYGYSYGSLKQAGEKKVELLKENLLKEFPMLKISYFVTIGGFKEELENFVSKHRVEAVVMGLEVKDKISKFIYGSHGVDLAGKINAPVIIVPEKYKLQKFSKLILAVDSREKLLQTSLTDLESILSKSKAIVELLSIRTEGEVFKPIIDSVKINGKKLAIETKNAKDLQEGIKKYVNKTADLIVTISRKHSAFYNFFVESDSKKIAFVAKVPVMVIHE